jgi:hypothetical protein
VGIGAKRPDPDANNRARFTMLTDGHLFYSVDDMEFTAHLMHAWSSTESPLNPADNKFAGNTIVEQPAVGNNAGTTNTSNGVDLVPDGKQTVLGLDARIDFGTYGLLYAGYAHMDLDNALTVAPAIESIHSFGGGEFSGGAVDNYLESPYCHPALGTCSGGTGSIDTLLAQYELGLANFDVFEGNQDLRFKLYGMANFIHVDDQEFFQNSLQYQNLWNILGEDMSQDGVTKLKYGLDMEYVATSWLSAGLRADHLSPNSKIPEQNFSIVSPRIVFHSDFVTREQISFQYSRYIYAQRECEVGNPAANPFDAGQWHDGNGYAGSEDPNGAGVPARVFCVQPPPSRVAPEGFGSHAGVQQAGVRGAPSFRPDVNVFKIEASMWW